MHHAGDLVEGDLCRESESKDWSPIAEMFSHLKKQAVRSGEERTAEVKRYEGNRSGKISLICGLCAWGTLLLPAFMAMTAMPIVGSVAVFQGVKALRSEEPGNGAIGIGLGAPAVLLAAWNWYLFIA